MIDYTEQNNIIVFRKINELKDLIYFFKTRNQLVTYRFLLIQLQEIMKNELDQYYNIQEDNSTTE